MQITRTQTILLVLIAVALVAAGAGAGYLFRSQVTEQPHRAASSKPQGVTEPASKTPLYYQDPDGKPDYSDAPRKTADGRDYTPVYAQGPASAQDRPETGDKKILYYRNPMGLPDTSPTPKKDSMGMDYIPVYANQDEAGVVSVSAARMQMLGVRTEPARMHKAIGRSVQAPGTVQVVESNIAVVTTKFDVVVEKLLVSTTGTQVRAGQPLARVWIDTPDTMMQRGPDVVSRQINFVLALQDKDVATIKQAETILRQYGMPESAIAEIRRTGRAVREITLVAPRSGIILDKQALEGMRFNTGQPLFKIADLSKIWVIANVSEQDIGAVRRGQAAHVSFVAFPERSFTGKVDFIYPTLMAETRTGRVRIVLSNKDGLLRESMYASVAIDTADAVGNPVLTVPDSAIIDSGASQVVLVAKGKGRFEPRPVQIGARGDGVAQIRSGLKPGEDVVIGANFLINAESNLRAALQTFNDGKAKNDTGMTP
ncbi:MAG: efflux RND transporter periplasmic adaptor subunit [Alphaproteobacteria bacterium]|nr:efflux RND transporter periplasmic adaptor subunit [Alphaproteobacteria bacterium]